MYQLNCKLNLRPSSKEKFDIFVQAVLHLIKYFREKDVSFKSSKTFKDENITLSMETK